MLLESPFWNTHGRWVDSNVKPKALTRVHGLGVVLVEEHAGQRLAELVIANNFTVSC